MEVMSYHRQSQLVKKGAVSNNKDKVQNIQITILI